MKSYKMGIIMYSKELEGERCDFCNNGKLQFKFCREIIKEGKELTIIENVPTFSCNHCGMRYHLAEVTKKMNAIARNKGKLKHQISVPIAEYETSL